MGKEGLPIAQLVDRFCKPNQVVFSLDRHYAHVAPLEIQAKGNVLIVGPGEIMEEVAGIEPFLAGDQIKSIDLVGSQPTLLEKVSDIVQNRYDIPMNLHPGMSGQFFATEHDPSYDTILFIGCSHLFSDTLTHFSSHLNPRGVFYITVNGSPPEFQPLADNCEVKVIPKLPPNATYVTFPEYYGIVVTKRDLQPGSFSDGSTPIEEDDFNSKEAATVETKNSLINELLEKRKITPQYANLLHNIRSSTTGKEQASLRKVKAVLALNEMFEQEGIAQKKTVNIGSHTDWQLPVALGCRDIILMDPELIKQNNRDELMESVRQFDSEAEFSSSDPLQLEFHIDLGEGAERVILNICLDNVTDFQTSEQIGCVIEYAGPTKSFNKSRIPVTENIAKAMAQNGLILNFDYAHSLFTTNTGMAFVQHDGFFLYEVIDRNKFVVCSQIPLSL